MSDETLQEELLRLGEETQRVREERKRTRSRWPEDFRRQVLEVLDKGARPREVMEATGLRPWTWREWRKRMAGFSELKIVSFRRTSSSSSVRLKTARGCDLTLALEDVKILLREGLL